MQPTLTQLLTELPAPTPSTLIYDLEIKRAICKPGERKLPDIEYCAGFDDKANMGISVLGAFSTTTGQAYVFMDDNWHDFVNLAREHECIAGHNHIDFDNAVVRATWGVNLDHGWVQYDTKKELAAACGGQVRGLTLDGIGARNFGINKTENPAMAPVYWQQGQIARVVNYCLSDVYLTARVILTAWTGRSLVHPANGAPLNPRIPL